ncbi:MAG: hypothetical protein GY754_11850 [bacterium]|nr:hypothetical protein [bacterium]
MKKWLAGVTGAVVSGILIFWFTEGMKTKQESNSLVPDSYSISDTTQKKSVSISISYSLGNMEEGHAVVYIEGRKVGNLHVSESKKNSVINVVLQKAGSYDYSIQARMTIMQVIHSKSGFDAPFEVESTGRGKLEVENGKKFIVMTDNLDLSDETYYALLLDKDTKLESK